MITANDITWLAERYPNLKVNDDRTEMCGELKFSAAYDKDTDVFTPLTLPGQTPLGRVLSGTYKVLIKKGKDGKTLPSLKIISDTIPFKVNRHFYESGNSCLCGPVEEVEFMSAGFSLLRYLEQLVYPFLYGQSFYDIHGEWPWGEYEHGAAGIFQSYYRSGRTFEHAETCLRKLKSDTKGWSRSAAVLNGRERVVGTSRCFCPAHKHIKNHASVWYGLLRLQRDLRGFGIPIN